MESIPGLLEVFQIRALDCRNNDRFLKPGNTVRDGGDVPFEKNRTYGHFKDLTEFSTKFFLLTSTNVLIIFGS